MSEKKDYVKEKDKALRQQFKDRMTQPDYNKADEDVNIVERSKRFADQIKRARENLRNTQRTVSLVGNIFNTILGFLLTPQGWIVIAIVLLLFGSYTFSQVSGPNTFASGCTPKISYVDSGQQDNFCEIMGDGSKVGRLSSEGGSGGGGKGTLMNGDYCHPFKEELYVAQPYGFTPWSTGAGRSLYPGGKHTGVDITPVSLRTVHSSQRDVEIFSITDGVVESSGGDPFGGNWVVIKTDSGGYLYYGHNKTVSPLKKGDKISKCDSLKTFVGNSGSAANTVAHIHLEYVSPEGGAQFGTGKYDEDPSKLFKKDGTLKQDEIIKGSAGK